MASIRCVTAGLRVLKDYECSYIHTIGSLFLWPVTLQTELPN